VKVIIKYITTDFASQEYFLFLLKTCIKNKINI
jgi:hypothetical protein